MNENGNPIQSTGFLNGKMPQLLKGVFEFAKANGEDWVTWQPQRNVRDLLPLQKKNHHDMIDEKLFDSSAPFSWKARLKSFVYAWKAL